MELARYRAADLDELQHARDAAREIAREIALCEAIKARGEAGVPHDVFMASLAP
jgi:hypothetical protein